MNGKFDTYLPCGGCFITAFDRTFLSLVTTAAQLSSADDSSARTVNALVLCWCFGHRNPSLLSGSPEHERSIQKQSRVEPPTSHVSKLAIADPRHGSLRHDPERPSKFQNRPEHSTSGGAGAGAGGNTVDQDSRITIGIHIGRRT